jgi:hypothetical protein
LSVASCNFVNTAGFSPMVEYPLLGTTIWSWLLN